jgi:hypothetical protein
MAPAAAARAALDLRADTAHHRTVVFSGMPTGSGGPVRFSPEHYRAWVFWPAQCVAVRGLVLSENGEAAAYLPLRHGYAGWCDGVPRSGAVSGVVERARQRVNGRGPCLLFGSLPAVERILFGWVLVVRFIQRAAALYLCRAVTPVTLFFSW